MPHKISVVMALGVLFACDGSNDTVDGGPTMMSDAAHPSDDDGGGEPRRDGGVERDDGGGPADEDGGVEPCIPAGDVPIPELAQWEANMTAVGREQCDYVGTTLDERLGHTYYDMIRVMYQIADYTGDASWNECAIRARNAYRDEYVIPNDGAVPGYWSFSHGLRMDFERTGDAMSREAAVMLAENAAYASDPTPLEWTAGAGTSREVAYAIMAYLNAERLGEPRRERLGQMVDQALGHIDQWVSGSEPYVQPFMIGLTAQALIMFDEDVGDARVQPAIESAMSFVWDTAWVPGDASFWYENTAPFPATEGAPDLNLLIAPAFAWLYARTGDASWRDRGDEIFGGGVRGAYLGSGKHFDQNYMWSFEYLRYRGEAEGCR